MSRIGIVALSEPRFGGTYQYTLSTIAALRRISEHRYTIYTSARNHWYDDLDLPVVRLPSGVRALALLYRSIHGPGLFSEVDKVVAPIYTTYLLASCRPFAFTLHDLQERHLPELFTYKQRLWRFTTNKLLTRKAARIICESNYVRDDITRFCGIPPERISVIPAPPVAAFRIDNAEQIDLGSVRRRLALPDQYLFYPAQFYAHKNHARLIDAFAAIVRQFPDCHLLFTGEKRYEYANVMSKIRERGLSSKILHLGPLKTDDLIAVYRMATVVVIPTLFESISIPIYEAFSLSVPVCASNVVALPEQVGDAALLFDPLSTADITGKIAALLTDNHLRLALAERGRLRVQAMTIDRYAGNLKHLLERL